MLTKKKFINILKFKNKTREKLFGGQNNEVVLSLGKNQGFFPSNFYQNYSVSKLLKNKSLYGEKQFKSFSIRQERNSLEYRKTKNSSYYYYILCRRHLNFSTEIEGKKKNLLGGYAGKLQHKVANFNEKQNILNTSGSINDSSLNAKPVTAKIYTSIMFNKTFNKGEKNVSEGVSISNFSRFVKDSKKHKSNKETNLMGKSFGFVGKSESKKGKNFNGVNKGDFFPYRKSFLCYWLLPFVGFVSSANLSLNKQPTKEYNSYISNTLQKPDLNGKQKSSVLNNNANLLLNSDTINNLSNKKDPNDFVPEYASKTSNPLSKFDETKMHFPLGKTFFLAPNQMKAQVSSKSLNLEDKNLYLTNSSSILEKNEGNFYSDLKTDFTNPPTSKSLKYCMLYLDCLENDLNLLEKTDQNKVITLPFLEQSNNLQKRALEHCASAFYPNSFFNRVLLKNGSFDKFLNEPLKIHFNVPLQNKNSSITNESLSLSLEKQKRFLEDKIQGFSTENNIKKMSDIVHEKMFLSQLIFKNEAGAYQVSNKTTLDDGQSRPHGTGKPERDPHGFPQSKFSKLNKKTNPPVTSFLRACTLLDKYMVYKPIVQDLQTEPVLLQTSEKKKNYLNQNIDVKPELINKLFSYFSNESTYLSSQKLINKSTDTDNVFLNSLNKNQKENLSPTFDFSFVNNFSPKKVTIIFKKLSFLDSKKTKADKTTKLFCPEETREGTKGFSRQQLLLNSKESGIRTNSKIYNKISKDKLYKVVLSTLKQTLNKSSSLLDSSLNETSKPFFSTKLTVDSYNIDSYSRNKSDVENLPTKFSSVRTIKFKHPILMSNKSEYPLLSSKNKSVSSNQNLKFEDLKNNFPSMFQTAPPSPVFKEKRPLDDGQSRPHGTGKPERDPHGLHPPSLGPGKFAKTVEGDNQFKNSNIIVQNQDKNKQNYFENQYFQLKTYINKYTRYALKDFLILNKISTYINPISEEYSIKANMSNSPGVGVSSPSTLKTDILPLEFYSKNHNSQLSSEKHEHQVVHVDSYFKNRDLEENSISPHLGGFVNNSSIPKQLILAKSPYVLDNKTKENLLQKKNNLDRPNEYFVLTQESPLKMRKIRQNDKTAKLLRAYFSIKNGGRAASKKNVYGMQNNPTSSNRLKHKIFLNLISKSYVQHPSVSKQLENRNKTSINKKSYVYPAKIKKGGFVNFLSTLLPETREGTFGFFRKNLQKTNFINEIKEFSISPTLLLNNRLLLKTNNTREGSNLTLKTVRAQASSEEKSLDFSSPKNKLFPNEEVLRKRKSIQKKRRITKLKKETRRRKKRMRFYPRPIWLRYRFYSQFLKNRRNMKKLNIDSSLNKISFNHLNNVGENSKGIFPLGINSKEFIPTEQKKNYEGKKIYEGNFLNSYRDDNFEVSKFPGKKPKGALMGFPEGQISETNLSAKSSKHYSYEEMFKKPKNLFGTKSYQHFPYSTGASNVNISPSVIGEFKTAFWKSYWLRSNLKPYFKKIKTSLKDIKETPKYSTSIEPSLKQSYLLKNVKNFLFSFLGLNNIDNVNSTIIETSKNSAALTGERVEGRAEGPPILYNSLSKKDIESYYKTANYLAEYNEISSKRIQQFVSQIRENLTLNGHVKVRPSRISINFGPKGLKKNTINFLKRPTLRYNSMSRLRLYWAFSKGTTNLAGLGPTSLLPGAETVNGNNFNKRKQIWTTEKFRQQTKENKTKKLLKDIKTKLQFLLNETPYISLERNIPLWNTLILKSVKKVRIQEEKLQNLAFVNNKMNSHLLSYNRLPKNKSISLRQFNIRNNRFKDSLKRTAKVQPFISGKTNYWWTYSNNTPFSGISPFLSNPVNNSNNLMQVYNCFRQDNIFNSQIKKGLSPFEYTPFIVGMESNLSSLQINTILFHFCSLITLLSISQIRGVLKFSFIGINKIYSLLERLIPSYLYSTASPFKGKSSDGLRDKPGSGYNLNKEIDLGLRKLQTTDGQKFNSQNNRKLANLKMISLVKGDINSDVTLSKNSLFDFEKRNDSFLYGFYVNKNQKDIKSTLFMNDQKILQRPEDLRTSSYFNPRLETQSKESNDYQNLYIKPTVNNLSLSKDKPFGFTLLPFLSITGVYSLLNYLVKKPIFLYYKWFNLDQSVNSFRDKKNEKNKDDIKSQSNKAGPPNIGIFKEEEKLTKEDFGQAQGGSIDRSKVSRTTQIKNYSILYSLLTIRFGFNTFMQLSKNTSSLLGQRAKLEGAFRSIYTFFEKPGVLIVDWIAYLFLVEWASDITTTLPENVDTQIAGSPFNKLTRTIYSIYPFLPWTQAIMNQVAVKGVTNHDLTTLSLIPRLTTETTFLSLASTFMRRRIYHLYEILVLQFYQPDTDLLVRQKKGIVFWDIWGDFLTQTAEDSNVNISELTSLKEEQMKLLENASDNISKDSFSKKSQVTNIKTKNIISSPKQKIYSKVSSITPLKFLLDQKQTIAHSVVRADETLKSARTKENSLGALDDGQSRPQGTGNLQSKFSLVSNKSNKSNKSKIISSVKPSTGSLGMPSTPFLGIEYQNIDSGSGLHQWGSQQFLSYAIKSKDTELFIDLHPPRALASVLKNKESSQQLRAISPMGSLVCQIFAGILYKQISKNILIVGNTNQRNKKNDGALTGSLLNDASASLEKTLLVQAIAGETELKIITDNAHRYALVYRGVAVGIKLLRDVFDSLSLQTPCFFLIEDIHAIGERRPFLISDDTPEGNTEIHEKNQVLYQLSKHVISHYKKPYKGDFSLSIPTNHFCFDFFKARNQNNSKIGKASISRQNTVSPKIYHNQSSDVEQQKEGPRILPSRLLRPSTEFLSPPATSPFSVLTLKEEKKFKTNKKVSDLPWTGKISPQGESTSSQDSQKTGPAYSIRAKVALLADIAISSLSVKLDMITDLLVIIDSVKGNRGFVVFATTHIPFVLDPALRRPGRLDETISFGFSSKNHSWEISHFGILNVPRPAYPNSNFISGFNTYASLGRRGGGSLDFSLTSTGVDTNTILGRLCQKAVSNSLFSSSPDSYLKRTSSLFHFFPENLFINNESSRKNVFIQKDNLLAQTSTSNFNSAALTGASKRAEGPLNTTKILSQVATKASAYLNASIKCFDHESKENLQVVSASKRTEGRAEGRHLDLHMNTALTQLPDLSLESTLSNSSHLSMYASPHFFKNNISLLISGKIGEFFLFSKTSQLEKNRPRFPHGSMEKRGHECEENSLRKFSSNSTEFKSLSSNFVQNCESVSVSRRSSLMPVITESISSLVLSFVQKRFLYKSNLMLPTLFNLTNYSSLIEPFAPAPPITSILLPAKRYENLKRSLSYYQNHDQNFGSGIMEKINIHQQQRLVKRLYNIPVKESFKSEIIENRLSSFSNASLMIGSMNPSGLQKVSSSNWFVRNRIFTRHSHYLTNQWWNGQLPEHNAETTFLSDIDWRYAFVEREARDILLDFPDADQHYNPRNRRWVGNTNSPFGTISMPSLTGSENAFYSEIYSHFIYDSFLKAFNIYEQNREVFDYYAFHICKQGLHCHLHEFERLKLIQRFLQN
uniref:Cell division protein n=1 Tax=Dunaliella salina TaxID=3046 RepID=D0FXY2_DUNSA|nr:cell division protein [Dunaliella salina]ACS95065.1 cell division protein [Dunaliella salina]